MIWIPILGTVIAAFIVGFRLWKSAETCLAMNILNWACTAYQIQTHDLLPVYLFVGACVVGALYLYFRGARLAEFIIMCLLAANAFNYGAFFFIGGSSLHWLEFGNWLILAVYCTAAGGAVSEYIDRHLDDCVSDPVSSSVLRHSRRDMGRHKED